jgi:DNA polymerase-3 subunit delta
MDSSLKKILSDIKARKPAPVYFLQGEEVYFIDLIANAIETQILDESERAFNQVVLYGIEITIPALLNHARRFPMMAERQVVIVREAQEIPDLNKETGTKLLLDYLNKPVPSTVLVLCHKHKTLDKRRELGKKAEQSGFVTTFKKIAEYKLTEFIIGHVTSLGFRIDEGAAQVLADYVGNDLSRLTHEAEKVLIGKTAGTAISAEMIMKEVGLSRDFNIFELQKALVTRNAKKAFTIVQYFQANLKKNPVIPCVAFLYTFFSKLLLASTLTDQGVAALTRDLKIAPAAANEYATALKHYRSAQLRENISIIKDADLKLKGFGSTGDDQGQILQELIFRLLGE